MLVGNVERRLKEIILEMALECRVEILEMETDRDHIHVLADIDPCFRVMNFIKKAKGRISKILREEFPFFKTRLPTL